MKEIIFFDNVCYAYDNGEENVNVIDKLNLKINKGEFVAVLGKNGSGKSTLAKLCNGIITPTKGKVFIDSIDTDIEDKIYDVRKTVGMVFQNPDNQIVASIVEEDVAFGLENLGVEPNEIRSRVDDALNKVGMIKYKNHQTHKLSGGQKQRVAIAGVIAMLPSVIIFDEPTAMLDPQGRKEVMKTIKYLNESLGITIVYITHFMREAVKADRVIVIESGRIIIDSPPKITFSNVHMLKNIGLDVPQTTELCYELRECNLNLPSDILTTDECVLALTKLLESE